MLLDHYTVILEAKLQKPLFVNRRILQHAHSATLLLSLQIYFTFIYTLVYRVNTNAVMAFATLLRFRANLVSCFLFILLQIFKHITLFGRSGHLHMDIFIVDDNCNCRRCYVGLVLLPRVICYNKAEIRI